MYEIIKSVINGQNYELASILKKIDTLWAENELTDEQREELITLARENADVTKSIDVLAKLQELEMRIKAMEEKKADEPTEEVIEPFVLGKWYYNGDKCSENGKNFICTAPEGTVCTWSPSQYPPYWKEI